MATFKVTKGTPVAFRDSAYPTASPSPHEGELFYNAGAGTFQFLGLAVGAWASGGALNTTRDELAGAGTQTAAIATGGSPNGSGTTANTEIYNGTAWTEVNNLNDATRGLVSPPASTTGASMVAGGQPQPAKYHEQWDGTSWTRAAEMLTAASNRGAAGVSTSTIVFGGGAGAANSANTELWNGTAWSELNDLDAAAASLGGAGTSTAAITIGGSTDVALSWNGTSWTEVNGLNDARNDLGVSGTQTAALAFGGTPSLTANTESWDGTSWTELANMATARDQLAGAGAASGGNLAALAFGGNTGSITNATEEWTIAHATKTIDVS